MYLHKRFFVAARYLLAVCLAGPGGGSTAVAQVPALAEAARAVLGAGQGVYIEASDGTVLLAQAAATPVHPASVSKVPTTLALLRKLGAEHRFATTLSTSGQVIDGTLYGDLVVASEGDPSLVDENALVIAQRLRASGITRIAGKVRLVGPLTFDWQPDSDGSRLQAALAGHVSAAAVAAVQALQTMQDPGSQTMPVSNGPPSAAPAATQPLTVSPALRPPVGAASGAAVSPEGLLFADPASWSETDLNRSAAGSALKPRALLVHRSQPLLALAKSLNDYSNNIFKPLADEAGGAGAVQEVARSAVPAQMRAEITLGDGAGTDPRNRLSPRAAVHLLQALDKELSQHGHNLFDILPVAGVDAGTLQKRLNAPQEVGRVVGKTGTFGDYGASALAGAIPTSDHGTVYFAILNHNVPVPEARRRQDRFVAELLGHLHSLPWKYEPDARPAVQRAELVSMSAALQ
jgi:serine-type D-Ala-D-Ala carboxypeptidase/endopeptidase (penicillin-binding protein 4)